jgi:hypothetical protein
MKPNKNIKIIRQIAGEIASRFPDPIFSERVRRRIRRTAERAMVNQVIEEIKPTHMRALARIWRVGFADIKPRMTVARSVTNHSRETQSSPAAPVGNSSNPLQTGSQP